MGNPASWIIGGLIALGVAAVASAAIYAVVNWDTIKKHFFSKEPASVIKEAMKLKIKERSKKAVKLDVLDEWDDKIADFEVAGKKVDASLKVGDTITLRD